MNSEKNKNLLLYLFISLILGGSIWAIFSLTYSPIKELRSNTISESNFYKDIPNNNNNNNNNNSDGLNNVTNNSDSSINNNASSISNTEPIETEIAKYSTTIYDTEETRIHNIKLAITKLNNATVEIGQDFSFNDTIGPMGEKQGYLKATGFDGNGKKIKIYGGGMCQISSTLYNAVLIANLEVTERHQHSKEVPYIESGKDATVSYGAEDLKIYNQLNRSVRILAGIENDELIIKIEQQ